jgi:ATP-binding cassette subfamily B protein
MLNSIAQTTALWPLIRHWRRGRVPVLLQLSAVECGAACLAMILTYYGRQTRVAECRAAIGIGRDGVTARTIAQAARGYGLRVRAFSLELTDFQSLSLPAIAHWDFNHFVVVERWSSQAVEIVDPATGRRRLTAEEFEALFTGVVLTLEPSVHFARSRDQGAPVIQPAWRSYLQYILHTPGASGLLMQILSASVLLQVLGLTLPFGTKVLVDQLLPLQRADAMTILGIGLILVVLMQTVSSYLRAVLLIYLQARLDARMMLAFFEHLLTLPFAFFQQRSSGDLLMRLGSNLQMREAMTNQTLSIVLDGTLVVGYLSVLLVQAPTFGALVISFGLFQVALLLGTQRRMHGLAQRDLMAQAESQSYLVETLTGIATLKAAGAEGRVFDYWSNLFFNHLNLSLDRSHLAAIIDTALTTMRVCVPLLLLWLGALRVLEGTLSLGTMLALNALAIAFLTPLASLVANSQRLQLIGAHWERLTDVLEAEPEQDVQAVQVAPPLRGAIALQNVSFRYDPHAPSVLRDLTVTIKPGQKVALVGRTASGKSTLALLLLGLCLPTEGDIRYDGLPLQALNYRTLRSQFGVVLQEPVLFSGSIRQNIALHDPSLTLAQVRAAARLAAIDDEIMQMPMGYETLVSAGGSGLSGGQRQRIALARALARQPAILVLDEATSHLDVMTERLVDEHLSQLACTRIVIAHRLSTIRNADLILVLDQGQIIEHGAHEELIAKAGFYAKLITSQLPDGQSLTINR